MGIVKQFELLGIESLVERLNEYYNCKGDYNGYFYEVRGLPPSEELLQTAVTARDHWAGKLKTSKVRGMTFMLYRYENEAISRMSAHQLDKYQRAIAGRIYAERGEFLDGPSFYELLQVTFECKIALGSVNVIPRSRIEVYKEISNGQKSALIRRDYKKGMLWGWNEWNDANFKAFILPDNAFLKKG